MSNSTDPAATDPRNDPHSVKLALLVWPRTEGSPWSKMTDEKYWAYVQKHMAMLEKYPLRYSPGDTLRILRHE